MAPFDVQSIPLMYNISWLLYAIIAVCALTVEVVLNKRSSKAARQNAYAWIATELGLFIRIGFWQLGAMAGSDGKFAEWAIDYDWILFAPFFVVIMVGNQFLLRRLPGQLWYMLGLSTIPAGIIVGYIWASTH